MNRDAKIRRALTLRLWDLVVPALVVALPGAPTLGQDDRPGESPLVSVSEAVGFNDEPAMAQARDGSLYVAWNSFRDGADSLLLARFRPEARGFQRLGAWQILAGRDTYVLGIRAVSAGQNVIIVYAAEKNKNWDVYAVTCGPDGPDEPVAVTSHAAVDIKPAAVWHNGTLWIAWESNRGGWRQIVIAGMRNGHVSEPVVLSDPETSNYAPSIAVPASGEASVAWHSFQENNYDIWLRQRGVSGAWGPRTRLTRAPSIDRHASLVARSDELWLIYENALIEPFAVKGGDLTLEYRTTRTTQRRLIVAQVAPQGLLAPKSAGTVSPLKTHCEAPSAAFDSSGRLWVAYLKPQLPNGAGWQVHTTCFSGRQWQPGRRVSARKGMDRRPCLVVDQNRAIIVYQVDNIKRVWWRNMRQALGATSDIVLSSLDLDSAPQPIPFQLEPLVEPVEPFPPGRLRVALGEDTSMPTITYQGQRLKPFFGNLHEHSDISVCGRIVDQSVDESYQHMRDITADDFACVTDHGFNLNPYYWSYTAKLARVNTDAGHFLTFLGEEWTSTFKKYSKRHPYGFYGHRNLVFSDPYFPKWFNAQNRQTPAQLWEELRKLNANFVQIPHQLADTGNVPTDWDFTDEQAQPVAEIFQVRGSYEYKGAPREAVRSTPRAGTFIQDAWARGVVIGVIASPDHGGGYGKACVFAPELTREAILDALRARHCYGATAAKIFLDVRVNGHLMGEKVAAPAGASVEVQISVRCPGAIARIDVCRNNRFIYSNSPDGRDAELRFVDRQPLARRSYYYVRVIQKDEEMAWSSPVWFNTQ